jgi:uncharacterized protein (DUF983 family)
LSRALDDSVRRAVAGHCPRCGDGALFRGVLKFADRCDRCGLDIASFNVGDGPAALLMLVLNAVVVALAMWLEFGAHPAWWVHVLVWPPVVVILTIAGLRVSKAILFALEYRHEAVEGRLKN